MGHGLLKTAAAWSILRLVMVNRYTFVVVNRECGTGESLHIRHGQSRVCGNGESLHIRRGQRHPKKTTKDQTTTITKDHQRPDDQKTANGHFPQIDRWWLLCPDDLTRLKGY